MRLWRELPVLLVSLLVFQQAYPRDDNGWEQLYSRMISGYDAGESSLEDNFEQMYGLADNPIDINRATRNDLQQLPFLSDIQIEEIISYRDRHAPLRSLNELRLIPGLDFDEQKLLSDFIYVGQEEGRDTMPSLRSMMRYSHQNLTASVKIPFYSRKGDNGYYAGYPYKHWIRYTMSSLGHLKAGFTASQDAGEAFFTAPSRMGYDFYSFYLSLQDAGRLRKLVVGRYKLRFGLGLALNNGYSLGKFSSLSGTGKYGTYLSGYSSRSEANYLQGAAATISLTKSVSVTPFVSWREIDATLNKDNRSIATILTSGYHRTVSEIKRRHNASQWLLGAHSDWRHDRWHAGITAFYTSLSLPLKPKPKPLYRRYYPEGRSFTNISADYGYLSGRFSFSGEIATGSCQAVATLNTVAWQAKDDLRLMLVQRYYDKRYNSLFSSAFSEGGYIRNENGLYLGADWQVNAHWMIRGYTDMVYFPWARYMSSASSYAMDNMLQAGWSCDRWNLNIRYRIKMRQRDNSAKTMMTMRYEHRLRMQLDYGDGKWQSRTQADASLVSFESSSRGWMISQNLGYRHTRGFVWGSLGYFHTDNYESRIYTYERGLLYNASFPSFFGHGIRYAVQGQMQIKRSLVLVAKLGSTCYFDRNHIGSSYQQIDHSHQTDLELQVRWKL